MSPPLFILSVTQGTGSGAERVLAHLLEGARETDLFPRLRVIAPRESGIAAAARARGYPVYTWPARRDTFAANLLAGLRFQPVETPALIHAWQVRAWEAAIVLGRRLACPVTATTHDAVDGVMHGFARRLISRAAARRLHRLAAVSAATAGGWKPYARAIEVVPNGLPDRPRPAVLRPELPVHVGFLGCHSAWKGIGLLPGLITATSDLPIHWHLYGAPCREAAPILKRLSPDRVTFHGERPIERIVSEIDLVFHPSRQHDPFPTVLLETARAGLPALASAVGGTGEIIRDEESGLLFALNRLPGAVEKLRRLVADRSLRQRLGDAARREYERRFRIETMVDRYRLFWNLTLGT